MLRITIVATMLYTAILCGCSTGPQVGGSGSRSPVKTSGIRPAWVSNASGEIYWLSGDKDTMYYRVAAIEDPRDYQQITASLEGQADAAAARAVQSRIYRQMGEALATSKYDPNNSGNFLKLVVSAVSERVLVSGSWGAAEYWEQYEASQETGKSTRTYDYYRLYSIPAKEFRDAKERAWNRLKSEAPRLPDTDARKMLEDLELKNRFLDNDN